MPEPTENKQTSKDAPNVADEVHKYILEATDDGVFTLKDAPTGADYETDIRSFGTPTVGNIKPRVEEPHVHIEPRVEEPRVHRYLLEASTDGLKVIKVIKSAGSYLVEPSSEGLKVTKTDGNGFSEPTVTVSSGGHLVLSMTQNQA